jgi:opacity protein-like surface antigen
MTPTSAPFGLEIFQRNGGFLHETTRAVSALVLAGALGVTTLAAQGVRSQFGIGLGGAIPTGAFRGDTSGEGFNASWLGMVEMTLHRPRSPLGLRLDFAYSAHGANDQLKSDLSTRFGQPADESIKLLGANAALTAALGRGSRVTPHLFGGVGVYHVTISVTAGSTTTHNSGTKLAWQVGGDINYRALFLDVRYVAVAAVAGFPRTAFLPITAGILFGRSSGH